MCGQVFTLTITRHTFHFCSFILHYILLAFFSARAINTGHTIWVKEATSQYIEFICSDLQFHYMPRKKYFFMDRVPML